MNMLWIKVVIILLWFLKGLHSAVRWENLRCSSDTEQTVSEGKAPDIGRFPWFGILQHSFYLGGKTRFAVTSGVLVHPAYLIAPAEDIARIEPQALTNNTKFIVWQSRTVKFSMDIESYYLHPEYVDGTTLASLALLQILTYGEGGSIAPVLPVCLPIKGAGAFTDLYAVKMTDEAGEVEKEVYKMNYVDNQDCEEFYYKHNLNYKKMSPIYPLCASSASETQSCVWEGGVALVTRQSWGYWKLIGFSVRGPGCGAPTRFLYIHDYLMWIDEVITHEPRAREEDHAIIFRRVSPIKLEFYSAKTRLPKEIGMCDRKTRGSVLYKDNSEILVNKNFVQGFFFMSVSQVAQVNCATVVLDVSTRTNAAIWIEHHCHQDLTGDRQGLYFKDPRPNECFVYFKSVAFIEFRFFFSFKALLEVTLYGTEEVPKFIPNPYHSTESTYAWLPTYKTLRTYWYMPYYCWWWYM